MDAESAIVQAVVQLIHERVVAVCAQEVNDSYQYQRILVNSGRIKRMPSLVEVCDYLAFSVAMIPGRPGLMTVDKQQLQCI